MMVIQACEKYIKEAMPDMGDEDRAQILLEAQGYVADDPELDLSDMVGTICGMRTMMTVLDTRKISPHQKQVIFGK